MIDLTPLGDRAFLARLADEAEARAWAASVRKANPAGVVEVVLAYRTVAVFADPDLADFDRLVADLRGIIPKPEAEVAGRLITLPVLYDGEDLPEVSDRLKLSAAEVIDAHAGREYHVFAIGFLPGFPYAGYLADELAGLPRREVPRTRVPAGSVAIVGRQTAVYPGESPGGWHLIGRTPLRIVDLEREHFPIQAGDRLRFRPIGPEEFRASLGQRLRSEGIDP